MNPKSHQDLANIIKGVHEKLRKAFVLTGDLEKVWNNHIAEKDLRRKYASAMLKLATEIWNEKESRIQWSYEICVDYFLKDGIQKSLLRELKKELNWSLSSNKDIDCLSNLCNKQNNYKNLNRKLKLLDVGSCYNPFSKFSIFSCTAIDLTPATKDVLQCDFLRLKIKDKLCIEDENNTELIFETESYDIVVFSLVLEYLPGKEQRVNFVLKAWKLLQTNGLLIIISPDSKSLQHNAPMMKSWQKALAEIGFIRIKYDKLTHLHCMAFRKISKSLSTNFCINSISKLLYIPQDFKNYDIIENDLERTDYENNCIYQQFLELPNVSLF